MEDRSRGENGRFESEHTDKDVVQAVADLQPAGTTDIAEELGIARQSADYRLRHLREEGRINGEKIGGSLVWSVSEE